MAFVFAPSAPQRRLTFRRRRGVDWRVVGMTALSAVFFIAMLARPI